MFKRTLLFLLIFSLMPLTAHARDRYVFFIENVQFDEMLRYSHTEKILNNSVKALSIQRKGSGDFSFFQSVKLKRGSSIPDNEVPLLESVSSSAFSGYVLKDGTYYVPSIIFLNGQSSLNSRYVHVNNSEELDSQLGKLELSKTDIIIISWTREKVKGYEDYLMPIAYYNGENKGVFYSETTRNLGILDFANLNTIIMNSTLEGLKIREGNINEIYKSRIEKLKNKRIFLTRYGYFLAISSILNSLLSRFSLKKPITILSTLAVVSPLAVLVEPVSLLKNINLIIMFIILLSLIMSLYAYIRKSLKLIPLLFLGLIYFDSITSNYLLRNSLLSYEPALGARFYGIGNEFLGIILAYTLILIKEMKIMQSWAVWGANGILLLLNSSGNNFGGFITCGIMLLINSSLKLGIVLLLLGAVIISLSENHIGKFFREILKGNFDYLYSIISSKLSTLKRLLSVSIWTKLSIISTAVYITEFFKGKFKSGGNAYQIVVCCIVVAVVNDSGIVSMALLLGVYINYMFVNLNLEENQWNT